MYNILTSLGYDFTEQVSTRSGFVIDFAIYVDRTNNQKIAIETDGSHFHSSPKQRSRDGFRDHLLRREGWTVTRFGEVFSPAEVQERIQGILQKWQPV